MDEIQVIHYCLKELKKAGVNKATCSLNMNEKQEFNVENGKMTLLRTTFNNNLGISVIINNKKGSTLINKTDGNSIKTAIDMVIEMANASQPDIAHDIAENQQPKSFSKGDQIPDLDNMYQSLEEFVNYVKSTYPCIQLEQAIMDFNHSKTYYQNTNGVNFQLKEGIYGFSPGFLAKDGNQTSSLNGTGFSTLNINKPLHEYGSIDMLLKQTVEQLDTNNIPNKFVGKLIVTPDCINNFLGFITNDISDQKMISGNSIYKEKLNEQITDNKLTFHSKPVSNEIEDGYFVTNDGYIAKNLTIIDKGILNSYLLGIYGAKKLGKNRSLNDGGAYIVESGKKSYYDIIKNIDQGILLSRFSGGNTSADGDFSGVAKNSYYIKNGEIKYPITETMVSGNICNMFNNIDEISKERINFGSELLPWISFDGVTAS